MDELRLDSALDLLHGRNLAFGLLWLGLMALTVTLIVLMYTRWGRFNVLRKCLALSLAAHLLLVAFSTTVYVAPAVPFLRDQIIRVSLSEKPPERRGVGKTPSGVAMTPGKRLPDERPWQTFTADAGAPLAPVGPPRVPLKELPPPQRSPMVASGDLAGPPSLTEISLVNVPAPAPKPLAVEPAPPKPKADTRVEPIQAPKAQSRAGARAAVPDLPPMAPLMDIQRPPRPPARTANGNVPPPLLNPPLSMPSLTSASTSPDAAKSAAKSLAKLGASPPPAAPAKTAESVPGPPGPPQGGVVGASDLLPDPAAGMGPAATESATSRLKPPSLLEGGGAGLAGSGGLLGPGAGPATVGLPLLPRGPLGHGDYQMPEVYRLRVAPNRAQISERLGATPELEAAVKAGLQWLANNQERDGRWSTKRHEGGREMMEGGRDRQGAGSHADTGITALAILAFAASGNTHLEGTHQAAVRRGLEFLLRTQGENGNLGGDGQIYEFMYCHGMATLALSELAGMTGDEKLRQPLARAVAYTVATQDPSGGGWRYRAQEAGDTSQLGWQLMSLKSARLAGIAVPQRTWRGVHRFLDSVSGGSARGLASYRPGEEITRSMTAEALACRLFLGLSKDSATAVEAGTYVMGELPGQGQPNLYYWYYGSIAMFQLQGDYWTRWSQSLRKTLLSTQRTRGTLAGSWDPNTRWDGYGGRVYSTALATLCLEAHYRFLPLNTRLKDTSIPPTSR